MGHPAGLRAGTRYAFSRCVAAAFESPMEYSNNVMQGFQEEGYDQAVDVFAPIQVSRSHIVHRQEVFANKQLESETSLTSRQTVLFRRGKLISSLAHASHHIGSSHKGSPGSIARSVTDSSQYAA
jgi:hypothetical protein